MTLLSSQDRRAAICLRLSDDPHKGTSREGEGIARQGEDCDAHAEYNRWPVAHRLVDNDKTALRRRPGFERLLKLIASGEISVVIAWSSERLLKTKTDEYRFYETCLAAPHPVIVSYARGMTFDLSTPQGRKFFDNAASDARYETELKSERQKRANRQHAEKGRPAPGPRPFGYEPDRVTLREKEAKAAKDVYRAILAKGNLASQVRALNDAGLRTGQGNLWRTETLRKWLTSPRNAGLRSHRGEVVTKAAWPGLVDEATWRAVKSILENPARRRTGKSAKGLNTGLARCGVCDDTVNMSGQSKTGAKNYTCRTGKHVSRAVEPVDELVSDVVIALIERDGADLLVDHERPDVDALREELEATRVLLKQLGIDYAKKRIPRATMLAGTEAAEADIAEIEARMADAGRVDVLGPAIAAPDVRAWWHSDEITNDQRRQIIATLMDVAILPAVRGRKGFDPTTVRITPKKSTRPTS
ncbi:recombinase family protein [Micromonospora sp. NPDC051925]|uniref:recombinase family protein n=1 Tax=Micromonospora sp. NPDC051925 TaxID=3364288 RepID=UPI0037CC1789